MMDQYREQYKKETEEIHAPADLIARTKAAVRREEERIQRHEAAKPVAQEGNSPAQAVSALPERGSRGAAARKWAYLLSAAAAVIVLASVSLMMRGLRFGKLSSESPAYEMAAADADSGGEESAAAGAVEEAFDEAVAAESSTETEGAAADREAGAAEVTEFAGEKETAGAVAEAEEFASADAADAAEVTEETKRASVTDELSAGEEERENTMSQKQESAEIPADAGTEITVEKVWKKPAFVNRSDAETQIYKDTVFQVVEEEDGWAAYVERGNGGGYVIRGEAESVEMFLEEGYRRLEEMSW